MWGVKREAWRVKCRVSIVKCGMWSVLYIAPATQNDTPHTTDLHQMLRLPQKMRPSQCPRLPRYLQVVTTSRSPDIAIRKKHATQRAWSAAPVTQNDDGHSQSAAPATKNVNSLLKILQKYCACHTKRHDNLFWNLRKGKVLQHCSFPCRHGDGRRKPNNNRDKTCWSLKTSISCETSSNFHTL